MKRQGIYTLNLKKKLNNYILYIFFKVLLFANLNPFNNDLIYF